MKQRIYAAILIAGLIFTASASAQEDVVEFRYNPTELMTPSGVEKLMVRIDEAAIDICKEAVSPSRWGSSSRAFKRCLRQVKTEIAEKIQNNSLALEAKNPKAKALAGAAMLAP